MVTLISSDPFSNPSASLGITCEENNISVDSIENNQSCSSRIERIVEKALSSKHIRELHDRAKATSVYNKSGDWEVKLVKEISSNSSNHQSNACCNITKREIYINENVSDEYALAAFVFELTNAAQANEHVALDEKMLNGQIDCENYTKETERIEHRGALLHHKVMSAAIKEMGWSKGLDCYCNVETDFEKDWSRIKNSSHANYYRAAFRERREAMREHEAAMRERRMKLVVDVIFCCFSLAIILYLGQKSKTQ